MNFLNMHAHLRVCVFSVSYLSVFVFWTCSVCACVYVWRHSRLGVCGGIRGVRVCVF